MAGGCAAFGNHSRHALCDGKCSILHPQGSQWPRNYQFLFICLHFFRSICFYFLLDLMIMITDIDSWQPKHIGNDVWDVAMERRDKKIMEMLSSPSPSNQALLGFFCFWYSSTSQFFHFISYLLYMIIDYLCSLHSQGLKLFHIYFNYLCY